MRTEMSSIDTRGSSSSSTTATTSAIHLIVLIHGLYGNPSNLAVVKEELERAAQLSQESRSGRDKGKNRNRAEEDEIEALLLEDDNDDDDAQTHTSWQRGEKVLRTRVLVLNSFQGSRTWDGIDINAHRAAKEIDTEIERLGNEGIDVNVFSLMGYSLGGLVARYLVGLIHARSPSFFIMHRPGSFSTFATPHVGVIRYGSRMNTLVHTVGRHLFSRSGRQLYRSDRMKVPDFDTDEEEKMHERSLLSILADPDHIFVEALKLFPRIRIVANGCNDLTVPYPSGAISETDPFVDHETSPLDLELDDKSCIVSHTRAERTAPPGPDSQLVNRVTMQMKQKPKPGREKHKLPPIFHLPIRWPFNYLGIVLVPLLIPIFLLYATITLCLHARQSAKRSATEASSTEHTPLLSRPPSRPRSPPPSVVVDQEGAAAAKANRIPLLLDEEQRRMIRNLDLHLPQMQKIITWWPWCFNTHAMLIVRAAKRFEYQEEGRGLVRHWAEWAVDEAGDRT